MNILLTASAVFTLIALFFVISMMRHARLMIDGDIDRPTSERRGTCGCR